MPTNQCTIVITSVSSNSSGTLVTVSGTAVLCGQVDVNIMCDSSFGGGATTTVTGGTWSVSLPLTGKCLCGTPIRIIASCHGDPQCQTTLSTIIPCAQNACCPILTFNTIYGECRDNGTRYVTINYTITPPTDPACARNYYLGDLNFPAPILSIQNLNLSYGNPPITGSVSDWLPINTPLTIALTQSNANGFSCPAVALTFTVPSCDPTIPPECCPIAIADIKRDETHNPNEKCNSDNLTKSVKIDAEITPTPKPGCPSNVTAMMYIDGIAVTGATTSAGSFILSYTGDFECGRHPVTIKYIGSSCPDSEGEFCVSACESDTCMYLRWAYLAAATTAIISWMLWLCNFIKNPALLINNFPDTTILTLTNPQITTVLSAILTLAIISTILWIIAWILWINAKCRKNCKRCRCLLGTWQISLASLLGFLILSKCSFPDLFAWLTSLGIIAWLAILIIILIMLIWLIIILYSYFTWVSECCPTSCEKWKRLLETFISVLLISYPIIPTVIDTACSLASNHFWIIVPSGWIILILALITAFVFGKMVSACKAK